MGEEVRGRAGEVGAASTSPESELVGAGAHGSGRPCEVGGREATKLQEAAALGGWGKLG